MIGFPHKEITLAPRSRIGKRKLGQIGAVVIVVHGRDDGSGSGDRISERFRLCIYCEVGSRRMPHVNCGRKREVQGD